MALSDDPTLAVLRDIYKAIQGTNSRLDDTNSRLDETNSRLGSVENRLASLENRTESLEGQVSELARRQTESDMRLATEVVHVAKVLDDVKGLLQEKLDDHELVREHDRRIAVLEARVG